MPWSSNLLAVLAIAALRSPCAAQQPMFVNRAVNPAAKATDVPAKVQEQYYAISSESSLLIPFCVFPNVQEKVCPDSGFYSLETVFTSAAARANVEVQTACKKWFDEATKGTQPPFGKSGLTLETMLQSFQLIAVVNRMDLAAWSGSPGKWSNAELRFIYGLKHGPGQPASFTLIVEFVLPDADWKAFQEQGCRWKSLGPPSQEKAGSLLTALGNVIEQTGYRNSPTVRIRANCQINGPLWEFSEWVFHSRTETSQASFEQSDLDFQVSNSYSFTNAGTGVTAKVAQERLRTYSDFWTDVIAKTNGAFPVAPAAKMATKTAQYKFDTTAPFLSPPASFIDSPQLRASRNVIALQQCTGCHARETNTPQLQHVSESGVISQFLLPNGTWNPKLEDLTAGGPAILRDPIHYCVTKDPKAPASDRQAVHCSATQTEVKDTRWFHDLARRKLFMATLLAAPTDGPGLGDIRDIIQNAPDFAH